MRKTISITIFLFAFLNSLNAQTGWFIQPSFTSQNLYDCKQSAYTNMYLGSDNGTIFRSINGGNNWSVYNFNDPLLNSSAFKFVMGQSNDNWAAVGQGAGYGFKYEPIDSVMRITSSPQPTLEALSSLSGYFFYTATSAAGEGGNFYIQDGPYWRKDTAATRIANGRKINYSHGFLFAGDNGLIMKADSIGIVHSNGERIKWRIIPSGTVKNLNCIYGGGGSPVYVAVGDDGTILRSTNYGESWTSVESPVTEDLYAVWLGYAYLICGANGTILRSYDMNLNKWYIQTTPISQDLYFIMSLGYSEFVSGGENGIFLRTTDGGGSLKRFITTSLVEGLWNTSTNTMKPDTLTVRVRSSVSPYNIIETAKEKTSTGGYAIITIGPRVQNSVPYYIQMNHRNSIETWSKTTLMFSYNDLYYDFYPAANRAFGDNQKRVDTSPPYYGFFSGDVNQDGVIDATDNGAIDNDAANFATGYLNTDLTGDDFVDASDAAIADNNAANFVSAVVP